MKVLVAYGSPSGSDSLLPQMQRVPMLELLPPTQTAQATLEAVRAHDPQVLIVNAGMPGAKETDLLQTIRAESPRATLIVLTNLTYREFRKRLDVWEDFFSMHESRRPIPLSDVDASSRPASDFWIKFSCGELGLLHLPDQAIFDVVATALQADN